MFNATNAEDRLDSKIEKGTDKFAALFNDVPRREQAPFIQKINRTTADPELRAAFMADPDAKSGSPSAKALGTGSSAPTSEQEALSFLLGSGSLTQGIKASLRRLLNPDDPDFIEVGVDGTPKEVGQLRQELLTAKADLAAEKAKPKSPVPVDAVSKSALKPKVDALAAEIKAAEEKKTVFSSESHLKKVVEAAKALVVDVS